MRYQVNRGQSLNRPAFNQQLSQIAHLSEPWYTQGDQQTCGNPIFSTTENRSDGCWARIIGPYLDPNGLPVFDQAGNQLWQWAEETRQLAPQGYHFNDTPDWATNGDIAYPYWYDVYMEPNGANSGNPPRGSIYDGYYDGQPWQSYGYNSVFNGYNVAREANNNTPQPYEIVWMRPDIVTRTGGQPNHAHIFESHNLDRIILFPAMEIIGFGGGGGSGFTDPTGVYGAPVVNSIFVLVNEPLLGQGAATPTGPLVTTGSGSQISTLDSVEDPTESSPIFVALGGQNNDFDVYGYWRVTLQLTIEMGPYQDATGTFDGINKTVPLPTQPTVAGVLGTGGTCYQYAPDFPGFTIGVVNNSNVYSALSSGYPYNLAGGEISFSANIDPSIPTQYVTFQFLLAAAQGCQFAIQFQQIGGHWELKPTADIWFERIPRAGYVAGTGINNNPGPVGNPNPNERS